MSCPPGCYCCCCCRQKDDDLDKQDKMAERAEESGGNPEDHRPDLPPDFRPGVPNEEEVPSYWGSVKQLYSRTGYNLTVTPDGKVAGTNEPYNEHAVLELTSPAIGEVQIKGVASELYVAMDNNGRLYGQADSSSEDTVFLESYGREGYNTYLSKKHADNKWYLAIKKSGKPKRGDRTAKDQKAAQFIPRSAQRPPE